MIIFGGVLFYTIVLTLIIWEAGTIYTESHGWSIVPIVAFVGLMWGASGTAPDVNLKYFLLWPIGSVCWLPIYWYVTLRRRASKLKKVIASGEKIEDIAPYEYGDIAFKKDGKIKIKHPEPEALFVNSLMFPISAPIFIFESVIESFIDWIKGTMDRIRDRISDGIQ